MYLARVPKNNLSLLVTILIYLLHLTSASPLAYSDQKLAEIDRLRATGASEAAIAHQHPLVHSTPSSAPSEDFWDLVFMWLGFRAPAASPSSSFGASSSGALRGGFVGGSSSGGVLRGGFVGGSSSSGAVHGGSYGEGRVSRGKEEGAFSRGRELEVSGRMADGVRVRVVG